MEDDVVEFSAPLWKSRNDKGPPMEDLSRAVICLRCCALVFDDLTQRHAEWHRLAGG